MKQKDKIFATDHLISCQKDFVKAQKFDFLNIEKQEGLRDLIKYLKQIDIIKSSLEVTSDIAGTKSSKENIPRLLGAGFHATRPSCGNPKASEPIYALELYTIIEGGVPLVFIKDDSIPCDLFIMHDNHTSYSYSCIKKETMKKRCEENGQRFREEECVKGSGKKYFGSGNKPCTKRFEDVNVLKNLKILIEAFDIDQNIVPIFSYSFFCNKLIWESFFGSKTFKRRAENNKRDICQVKEVTERGSFLASFLESKNINF